MASSIPEKPRSAELGKARSYALGQSDGAFRLVDCHGFLERLRSLRGLAGEHENFCDVLVRLPVFVIWAISGPTTW